MNSKISRQMSYFLRHHPDKLGVDMDSEGWVEIDQFLEKLNERFPIDRALLGHIVETNNKKRFIIKDDKIRASQGHTWKGVKITFKEKIPPVTLYHGTTTKRFEKIKKQGLLPMGRHHVHLSDNEETAMSVASRHKNETPLILKIDTKKMVADNVKFFISDNGVWLTDEVKKDYFK